MATVEQTYEPHALAIVEQQYADLAEAVAEALGFQQLRRLADSAYDTPWRRLARLIVGTAAE